MNNHKENQGFTLLELSIVLIIFGTVVMVVAEAYRYYNMQQSTEKTKEAIDITQTSLQAFQANFGRYPCPAGPSIARGAANYGRELVDGTGNCRETNGVKKVLPSVDINGDGAIDQKDAVYVGAVPFNTMLDPDNNPATNDGIHDVPLNDFSTYDGYNHKLTYAVTYALTKITTYNDAYGAIDIVDEYDHPITAHKEDTNGNGILDPGEDTNNNGIMDSAQYAHAVIISHGQNGRGAYTSSGQQPEACPGGLPVAILPEIASPENETENCDWQGAGGDAKFLNGLRSDKIHSFNDDTVHYMINESSSLWNYAGTTDKIHNTNAGRVGFGIDNPTERLEVNGDLRSWSSQSEKFCDPDDPARCMNPLAIAGDLPSMDCGGKIVTSIEMNKVNCATGFTKPPAFTCPAGCYVTGFQKSGGITSVICRQKIAPYSKC